jgi:hypothetical protein
MSVIWRTVSTTAAYWWATLWWRASFISELPPIAITRVFMDAHLILRYLRVPASIAEALEDKKCIAFVKS